MLFISATNLSDGEISEVYLTQIRLTTSTLSMQGKKG